METIYLDSNSTTRPAGEVVEDMARCLAGGWANPSSVHRPGQAARREVELAREAVAGLVGGLEREIVFAAGGTEAANLAVRGALAAQPARRVLVTSRLEHPAVRELAERLEAAGGVEVVWLANDRCGLIDVDELRRLLGERAAEIGLVSIMWANNETGVVQPVGAIGGLCREHGVLFHTDATQYVGKMPVDVSSLPVDLLGFSAHKFHGPKGAGALWIRRGVRVEAQLVGGPQERGRRGGTENTAGIAGLGCAARLAGRWLATGERSRLEALRDDFERRLLAVGDASVNGAGAGRLWNVTSIAFGGVEAEPMLLMFSERGLCVSAGAACSSGSLKPSSVLAAMGLDPEAANGSIRFSLCRDTTEADLDRAAAIVAEVVERLRALAV